jgi:glycine cleavage system H protein
MKFPQDLRYSEDHEWVRVEGGVGAVGITDHAQDALGDIVYLELPNEGDTVTAGDVMGSVESVKAVSEIYSPISGKVVAVHTSLTEQPELVNSDPYGEGWMVKVELSAPSEADALMDAATYEAFVAEETK